MEIILKTLDDTVELGTRLGELLKPGDVLAMVGDLGAGKTTLAQAIGRQLGVSDYMTSPTFAVVNQYDWSNGLFVHADLYRLEDADELAEIGFEQYFDGTNIIVVEWADKFRNWFDDYGDDVLWLTLRYAERGRSVQLSGARRLIDKLEEACS